MELEQIRIDHRKREELTMNHDWYPDQQTSLAFAGHVLELLEWHVVLNRFNPQVQSNPQRRSS